MIKDPARLKLKIKESLAQEIPKITKKPLSPTEREAINSLEIIVNTEGIGLEVTGEDEATSLIERAFDPQVVINCIFEEVMGDVAGY